MIEIWKDIAGYDGAYQVSNLGRVKSMPRIIVRPIGTCMTKERIIKTYRLKGGYVNVMLRHDGKSINHNVHRLVAEAFIPNKNPEYDCINHKDGCKQNNKVSNLEWCTKSENTQHAFATGLKKPACGEKHGCAKLKEKDVEEIRVLLAAGNTGISIAKKYGISASAVSSIKRDKAWKIV